MRFFLKCLNSRRKFWRGCFLLCFRETVLGTVVLSSNRAALARAHQGSDRLRTGLAHLGALCPPSVWSPQHMPAQGRGSAHSLPGAAQQPLLHLWPKASFVQWEESILCAAVTHSQVQGSNGAASLSISSWPGWDTAGQLARTATLRAPHGHATRVPLSPWQSRAARLVPTQSSGQLLFAAGTAICTLSTSPPL